MSIPKVIMRYGADGAGDVVGGGMPYYVQGGVLEYDNAVEATPLDVKEGGVYWLITSTQTKATDAYASRRITQIIVPTGAKYGNTQCNLGHLLADGTQRVTINNNRDSTVSIVPTGVVYRVRYALYKVA